MESFNETRLRNLPNLDALLQRVEDEQARSQDEPGVNARRDLIDALGYYLTSRFRLGEALANYREGFVANHLAIESL